MTQYGVLWKE